MLEPEFTDTQLQSVRAKPFISLDHTPLILTAYAAGMSVVPGQLKPTSCSDMSLKLRFTDKHLIAAPVFDMSSRAVAHCQTVKHRAGHWYVAVSMVH